MPIFSNGVSAQMSCKCDIVLFIYLTLAHRAYVKFTNMFEYVCSRDVNVHLCL